MRSIRDHLTADLDCDSLLECVNGLHELDRTIYFHLLETDECTTVEEIAAAVDRDRSTAYRAVRRLHDAGYLNREQVTYENGGYCYRYEPNDPDDIAASMSVTIDEWHARLDSLVEEFRAEHGRGTIRTETERGANSAQGADREATSVSGSEQGANAVPETDTARADGSGSVHE